MFGQNENVIFYHGNGERRWEMGKLSDLLIGLKDIILDQANKLSKNTI